MNAHQAGLSKGTQELLAEISQDPLIPKLLEEWGCEPVQQDRRSRADRVPLASEWMDGSA